MLNPMTLFALALSVAAPIPLHAASTVTAPVCAPAKTTAAANHAPATTSAAALQNLTVEQQEAARERDFDETFHVDHSP